MVRHTIFAVCGLVVGTLVTIFGIIMLFFVDIIKDISEGNVVTGWVLMGSAAGLVCGLVMAQFWQRRKAQTELLLPITLDSEDIWPPPPTGCNLTMRCT